MARRKIEEVELEVPGTPGGEALAGVAGGSMWQSSSLGQDAQSDTSDGEGAYAPESVDASAITQDTRATDLINTLSVYFEDERAVDASEQGEGRSDGSVSGSAVSLDNTTSSHSAIDPPSPPPSQPIPPSPPAVRRRKRSEPTSRAATDIFHDLNNQSESDRDLSPMQPIPRPRSAPLAQKAIARTEAATRQRPGDRGDNGIHKTAWRLSAAPLKLHQSPLSPRPYTDEQVDPAAYTARVNTEVLQDFIERQEALERDRQQLLAKRRLEMRTTQQQNCRPGVWLRQARRYFKSDGRTEASEPGEESFLRRTERRREAKRLADMKRREERDMQQFGGTGHVPCVNRRSRELLARRQRLARGRAKAFERLYTGSKSHRAEKIISSILLDKSALSDAPRKLRTRRRRSSLLDRRGSERRASDSSMLSVSEASFASDDGTSVDLAVGYTREDQSKTFSRALRERLRARIEANKLRLENREVLRAEGVEPPPLRHHASRAAGIISSPATPVGGFRKKSQRFFRKRVENEVVEVLKEHGQEDTQFVTRSQAEQILRRLFVLPDPDEFAKWHTHEGEAGNKGEGRRRQHERLIEQTWAFLQTLTTFELGYAPLPGSRPDAPGHPEVEEGEGEEGLVSLEAVVVLGLRVASQGMQTLRSPTGELYYLTAADVTLLTQLRRQHLLLRLAHKARPSERRAYQPPGQQTQALEDTTTQHAFMSRRSKQLVEKLMRKNAEKLRELNIEAPDVYHSWLTDGANLKVIKRALGPLGGHVTGGTVTSTSSRVIDLCNVLAYSAEVRGLRREGEQVARLQQEMKGCTFTPKLNKKTLHLMKGQGRQPLSVDSEASSWQDVQPPTAAYRPNRHNTLYKEGTRKLNTRRELEQQRDPDVLLLRQLLDQVRREKAEPELSPAMARTTMLQLQDEEKRKQQEARQKEQRVEREATIQGLLKELQQEGCYKPRLPDHDPEAAATRLRTTLYSTMASDSVKSYQSVVDRMRRGAAQRRAKFVYVEQLRGYYSSDDDSDDEGKARKPRSPRKANTVVEPFNLSPRRELPSHIRAHEREEQRAREKEEDAARHRRSAREQFEASQEEAANNDNVVGPSPATPSYSQYFHGERALGGGPRTAFEATDPLLFVDVVLSGDRNKIRVPVCRGDSPKQVAKEFGRKHNLSNEAVHLLEVTFRTHMAQTLRKELSEQSPGF